MTNHCGTCTACCRVYAVPEIAKPAGPWCKHCDVGVGCKIYEARPKTCVDYKCVWLQSQESENPHERLAPELRPDKSKVVLTMTTNPKILGATTMPGAADAWKRPAMHAFLRKIVDSGMGVAINAPNGKTSIKWTQHGMREVEMTPPDSQGMQWSKEPA
jgi:hypothetical protein